MTAGIYDFDIEQGTDFHKVFAWENSNGSPIDLSGYTARMQFRDRNRALVLDVNDAGTITVEGVAGRVVVDIPNVVTSDLDFDIARYDLKLTTSINTKSRLIQGNVQMSRQETI